MAEDERELTYRTQHTRPFSSLTQGTLYVMRAELYKCKQCCYITVDFATAASQNGSSTYPLSPHKNNIDRKFVKNIPFFSFRLLFKEHSLNKTLYAILLRYANIVL
jgi:hypothetical protein